MRDRIYNYLRGYRYKTRYRIHKTSSTDTKRGTGFIKLQVTDTKRGTGFIKLQVTNTKRDTGCKKNQGIDTVPHQEKYGTERIRKMKPTSENKKIQNTDVIKGIAYQFTVPESQVPNTYEEGEVPH
jgi:hypothetical protein